MTIRARMKTVALFSLFNLPIAWLIALRFLNHIEVTSASEAAYLTNIYLGHFGFIILMLFLPLVLFSSVLPQRISMLIGVVGASCLQLFLLLDTFIYDLYRFHFSGFVLDLLVNGGSDVFSFSLQSWLMAIGAVVAMLLLQYGLWRLAQKVGSFKSYFTVLGVTFTALLSVNLWHAWADANYRSDVTSFTRHFPFFYPATAKRMMADFGLTDPQALRENMEMNLAVKKGQGLNYPTDALTCQAPQQPYNLLVVLVDTLRADVVTEDVMPNLYRFAQQPKSFSLTEHFSGGNSTKAGVFSLFYGLPVSYWDAFTAAQKPPVLMDELQSQGYDFKVLSSATLVSPSFDRNIFAGLKDVPLYTAGGAPWERDQKITAKWQEWFAERQAAKTAKPFFGFLFFDAVHGYSVPPEFPHFEPYWETVNHMLLNKGFDRTPYFNRYKTSAKYVDQQLGMVLDQLKNSGALDNTVVLITSDHGESFNEHGRNFWGHGSNYTREQVQVPVVVHWPNETRKPVERRTSHADIPVTLMENLLGCHASEFAYSLGTNLFNERKQEWVVSGSYLGQAILLKDHYVDIPLSGQHQAYDYSAKRAPEFKMPPEVSMDILKAMSRYYK